MDTVVDEIPLAEQNYPYLTYTIYWKMLIVQITEVHA